MAGAMDVNKMAARYNLKIPGVAAPALSTTDLGAARHARSRKGSRDETITPPDEPGSSRGRRKGSRAGHPSLPGEANEHLSGEKKKRRKKKAGEAET